MTTARATTDRHGRTLPLLRPRLVASAAALGVGLFIAGCNTDPSEAAVTAPVAVRASLADAYDHVGPQQGDEAGVASVVAAWDAAWNAGDAAGIAATFVDDGEFINGMGRIAPDAATIRAQHAVSLAGQFRGSRTEGTIRRITFLTGTTAVVDVDNTLWRVDGPVPTVQHGRHKRVVVKRGGEWRVLLMQITTVAPAAP